MDQTPTKIPATAVRMGDRIQVEFDAADCAVALDEECAKLREQVAEAVESCDNLRAKLNAMHADLAAAQAELAASPIGPAMDAPDSGGPWLHISRGCARAVCVIHPSMHAATGRWHKIREVTP